MSRPRIPSLSTFVAVAGAVLFVFWQLDQGLSIVPSHLHPGLLFTNTTTTGGDTGAHVATAAFLRSQLLPHLHLTGWDPQWYDGFPLYTFYFPLPDTVAALLSVVLPFNVAFKLATVLGLLTLPVAAWAFGRLAGLERPRPATLAAFTLPFLFDQTFTIYGGNIYSTMAGEYAYSLGLSVALVFLGLVARGLRTGKYRVLTALALAVCFLCHLVAAMFALAGAVLLFFLLVPSWRRLWWMVSALGTGMLLVAFWLVPFGLLEAYSTNMGWQNVHTFAAMFAPGHGLFGGDRWVLWTAGIGATVALALRRWPVVLFGLLGAGAYVATVVDPQGKLYNTRFVPLWWLSAYLLLGALAGELSAATGWVVRRSREFLWWRALSARAPLMAGGTVSAGFGAGPTRNLAFAGPGPIEAPPGSADTGAALGGGADTSARVDVAFGGEPGAAEPSRQARRARWAPGAVGGAIAAFLVAALVVVIPLKPYWFDGTGWIKVKQTSVPSWVAWNYSGYQAKSGWTEFEALMSLMTRAGARYGCGRAFWEYSSDLNRFGTPMSLMLMPQETGGCVDTQEGLLFESATSTPFHFIDQSELSAQPSDAMVGLPYGGTDVTLGVEHLQLLGVKYLLLSSASLQAQADTDPSLTFIGRTGPWTTACSGCTSDPVVTTWKLYLVHDAAMVSPLTRQPVVLRGVGQSQPSWLLPVAIPWYQAPGSWDTELVEGGPAPWQRMGGKAALGAQGSPEPPVSVSGIHTGTDSIGFHVDRTGVPVLVKTSYFPAWHAHGALGPWRATPNLMVVVPTSHDVTLSYGSTGPGNLGAMLSVLGVGGALLLFRRRSALIVP